MTKSIVCAAIVATLAPIQSQDAPPPAAPSFRILVLPDADDAAPAQYSQRAARLLEGELQKTGMTVIDREQALLLSKRSESIMASWMGGASAMSEDERLASLSYADVLVKFGIAPTSERKVQGRYAVKQTATFRVLFVDGAEQITSGEATSQSTSFDGFGVAHSAAVDALCDARIADSLVGQIASALAKTRDDETTNGARVTVGFYVDNRFLGLLDALRGALQGAPGTVAGSVRQLRNYPSSVLAGDQHGTAVELRARFRGDMFGLQMALIGKLQEVAPALEKEHAVVLSPTFVASGRRLDMLVKAGPTSAALADEVARVVREAVDSVWSRNANVLEGKRVVVLPTSIAISDGKVGELRAFRRGFEQALTSAEKRLQGQDRSAADPLTESGAVQVGAESFTDLAAAKTRLMDLEEKFYESEEGNLAVMIADSVASSLDTASANSVNVQPSARDRDRALDLIKLEAAAYHEDEAVDPTTIALYQQRGSEFFMASRVRKFFDKYVVTIDAVDLASGARYQGTSAFHPSFSDQLRDVMVSR